MSALELLARALARADHPSARNVFLHRNEAQLYDLARRSDSRAALGKPPGLLGGRIVVIKGNIDMRGLPTTVASRRIAAAPATENAPLVRRLIEAGGLPMGHANMSEFAFSGLGTNPHFGTPLNALDADLVPGGSSSGCASAVALGVANMAVGTDTSGSTRVPAACQGICGFRPTMGRYDGAGITPLAPSLDTPGPMARDMAALLELDAALRGGEIVRTGTELSRLITLPPGQLGPLDPEIRAMFDRALRELRHAGFQIDQRPLPAWQEVRSLFRTHGTLVAVEAPDVLAQLTDITSTWIDPVIRQRLEVAATLKPSDARKIREARVTLQSAIVDQLDGALLLIPTLPAPPPRIKDVLADTQAFATENARALSLTMPGAYLDMPSLALPCGARPGHSMTVAGASGDDDRVLWVGQQLESLLSPLRSKVLA